MKKRLITVLAIWCTIQFVVANPEFAAQRRGRQAGKIQDLVFDTYYFKSATDSTRTDARIYVSFCNDVLQFVKESNYRFHAKYEVTIALLDDGGNQVAGKSIVDDIFVRTFAQTNSRKLTNLVKLHINVVPGTYNLLIELVDLDTQREIKRRQKLEVRKFAENQLAVSDVIFTNRLLPDSTTLETIIPNIQHNFTDPGAPYGAYFFVYPAVANEPIVMTYTVKEVFSGDVAFSKSDTLIPKTAKPLDVMVSFQNELSKVQKYSFILSYRQGNRRAKQKQKEFVTSWNYLDASSLSVEQSIEPMRHLLRSREWRWVQEADDSTKDVWFRNYWKKRDPTPDTEENELKDEFYRRVAYASRHFAVPSMDKNGWNTDRGRIYLKYGRPSNIERRAGSFNSPSYEIWYYNQIERRFIFEDRSGFGDYQLIKIE